MNDEVLQIQREAFQKIVLGLATIGVVAGALAFIFDGIFSPWLIWAVALIAVAVVTYAVYLVGRLVVASYVLVLELIGLAFMLFLQSGTVTGFTPYLLIIPIVIISGLLLNPAAILIITAGIVVAVLLFLSLSGQFSGGSIGSLIAPLVITGATGLLAALNRQNLAMLGKHLLANRMLLKERALELMQSQKRLDLLRQKTRQLGQKLKEAEKSVSLVQTTVSRENDDLTVLIDGTIGELNESISNLEQFIEKIGDLPTLNGHHEMVEQAWQQLHQLKTMAVNLEEMTEVERAEFHLSFETVDVGQLISEIAGTARGLAREKSLEIRHHVADDVLPIKADPHRLRQVMLHIVNNAIKYTDQGVIKIRAENDNKQLVIFVSDTGIGMSDEEAGLVFEKFGRGNSAKARKRQGSGLGLAISKRLIDLHGGRIWVSSVPDVGSTFYLALPQRATSRRPEVTEFSGKTTVRLGKLEMGSSKTAVSARAPQKNVPVADDDDADTLLLPTSDPRRSRKKDDGGDTLAMPQSPARIKAASPPQPKFREKKLPVLVPPPVPKSRRLQSKHPTQPIHRYQPTYIRRFGFILLGILFVILALVLTLALANYFAQLQAPQVTAVAAFDSSALINGAGTVITGSIPPGNDEDSLVPPAAPPTTQPAAGLTPPPTHTPTQIPPSPTPVVVIIPTETAEPSPTPLPPTATATATLTPSPPPTDTPTATNTASPLPTFTPTTPPPSPTSAVVSLTPPPPSLLFVSGTSAISQFDFDGGNTRAVPVEAGRGEHKRVSRSPDGQVLVSGPGGQGSSRNIYGIDAAGNTVNLTASAGDDLQPVWSPNGSQIAFSSGRTGNFNIFVMQADGSNPIQLTDSRGYDEWPAWSSDGQQLAFVSDRDGNVEVYTMNADGSNQQRLTNNPADDWPAAWSPDGQWLVFASNRDGNWNLYLAPTSGGPATQLTADPADERDPIWSPDGSTIAFSFNGGDSWDIYTLPAPTAPAANVPRGAWTQITSTPVDERYPTWGN